jgi:hypothetical protein
VGIPPGPLQFADGRAIDVDSNPDTRHLTGVLPITLAAVDPPQHGRPTRRHHCSPQPDRTESQRDFQTGWKLLTRRRREGDGASVQGKAQGFRLITANVEDQIQMSDPQYVPQQWVQPAEPDPAAGRIGLLLEPDEPAEKYAG